MLILEQYHYSASAVTVIQSVSSKKLFFVCLFGGGGGGGGIGTKQLVCWDLFCARFLKGSAYLIFHTVTCTKLTIFPGNSFSRMPSHAFCIMQLLPKVQCCILNWIHMVLCFADANIGGMAPYPA